MYTRMYPRLNAVILYLQYYMKLKGIPENTIGCSPLWGIGRDPVRAVQEPSLYCVVGHLWRPQATCGPHEAVAMGSA